MTGPRAALRISPRLRRGFSEFVLGPPFARRLALSHALDDFGNAMVNLSLVNSLATCADSSNL